MTPGGALAMHQMLALMLAASIARGTVHRDGKPPWTEMPLAAAAVVLARTIADPAHHATAALRRHTVHAIARQFELKPNTRK